MAEISISIENEYFGGEHLSTLYHVLINALSGRRYCVSLRKCVRLDLQTAGSNKTLGLVKTFQGFGFLTLEIFSLPSTSQDNCGESRRAVPRRAVCAVLS